MRGILAQRADDARREREVRALESIDDYLRLTKAELAKLSFRAASEEDRVSRIEFAARTIAQSSGEEPVMRKMPRLRANPALRPRAHSDIQGRERDLRLAERGGFKTWWKRPCAHS